LVILVVLALRALVGSRLSGRWLHALWLVVMIRIATPWAPEVQWSPFALLPGTSLAITADRTSHTPFTAITAPSVELTSPLQGQRLQSQQMTGPSADLDIPQVATQPPGVEPLHVVYGIWLAGIILLGAYVCWASTRLWRTVTGERLVTDQVVLELLEDCKQTMHVRAPIGVIVTDKTTSPALFGCIRPRLLLPPGVLETLDRNELRHVFLHELAHLRRHSWSSADSH
jgi:bla regulator protein blaR1